MLLHVEWSSWRRQPEEGKERGKRRQGEREDGEEEGEEDQATAPWQAESQPALGPLPLFGVQRALLPLSLLRNFSALRSRTAIPALGCLR